MSFTNITEEAVAGLGVYGLPDTPELDVTAMQTKFDEYSWFLKDFINSHITELEAKEAAASLGAEIPAEFSDIIPEGATEEQIKALQNVQTILNALAENRNDANRLITMFANIFDVATNLDVSSDNLLPTTKAVVDRLEELGAGDMTKATYDQNRNGIVDDSEKLGGQLPFYYATKAQADGNTKSIDIINRNLLAIIAYIEAYTEAVISGLSDNYVIYEFDSDTEIIDGALYDTDEPYYVWA
jgi:hypothetical protein